MCELCRERVARDGPFVDNVAVRQAGLRVATYSPGGDRDEPLVLIALASAKATGVSVERDVFKQEK